MSRSFNVAAHVEAVRPDDIRFDLLMMIHEKTEKREC